MLSLGQVWGKLGIVSIEAKWPSFFGGNWNPKDV